MVVQPSLRDRMQAAFCTAAVLALLGYAFVAGLKVGVPAVVQESLKVFDVLPDPPPPPVEEVVQQVENSKPSGAAAPPGLKASPTQIVVPPPIVVLTLPPPPIVTTLTPGVGNAPSAGNAEIPGPGPGSGGKGNGTGSGGSGNGAGSGYRTPPRHIKGHIKDSDYPDSAAEGSIGGTVSVRYIVAPNGRAVNCEITHSSGNAALDETTCRLIEKRYRYEPSRDANGRPLEATVVADHSWIIERRREGPPPTQPD